MMEHTFVNCMINSGFPCTDRHYIYTILTKLFPAGIFTRNISVWCSMSSN